MSYKILISSGSYVLWLDRLPSLLVFWAWSCIAGFGFAEEIARNEKGEKENEEITNECWEVLGDGFPLQEKSATGCRFFWSCFNERKSCFFSWCSLVLSLFSSHLLKRANNATLLSLIFKLRVFFPAFHSFKLKVFHRAWKLLFRGRLAVTSCYGFNKSWLIRLRLLFRIDAVFSLVVFLMFLVAVDTSV